MMEPQRHRDTERKMQKKPTMQVSSYSPWLFSLLCLCVSVVQSLVTNADNHVRLAGEWSFEVAGGDEEPAAVQDGAAVDHARRLDVGVFAQVERPLQFAIGQVDGVDDAHEIAGVGDAGD